jgi:hypothetical protein
MILRFEATLAQARQLTDSEQQALVEALISNALPSDLTDAQAARLADTKRSLASGKSVATDGAATMARLRAWAMQAFSEAESSKGL